MQQLPIILSVSEVTHAIKLQLEPCFRRLWVRGEVTNYRLQSSGHHYFSLIEGGAQLACVMFRTAATSLLQALKNGDTIIAEGEISVYPPRGSYQLVVRALSQVGLGEALVKLQALKQKLTGLGWFRQERKRPLPSDIKTIAIVTSPSGAVLHDIINILTRRIGGFHIIVNPVHVQGAGAAEEIARAIHEINTFSLGDVIIICRGGGSAEDLASFNEECVAAACFHSEIPIVSAIGHEVDLSITDLVCDVRAPTPSAAAELISQERSERQKRLSMLSNAISKLLYHRLSSIRCIVQTFSKRLHQSIPQKHIELYFLRLDDFQTAFDETIHRCLSTRMLILDQMKRSLQRQTPISKLTEQRSRLHHVEKVFCEKLPQILMLQKQRLHHLIQLVDERMSRTMTSARQKYYSRDWSKDVRTMVLFRIHSLHTRMRSIRCNFEALNPKKTLQRGYAIVFRENSAQVIRSVNMVQSQEHIRIMLVDGIISAITSK